MEDLCLRREDLEHVVHNMDRMITVIATEQWIVSPNQLLLQITEEDVPLEIKLIILLQS